MSKDKIFYLLTMGIGAALEIWVVSVLVQCIILYGFVASSPGLLLAVLPLLLIVFPYEDYEKIVREKKLK
jgi:hypothetical protein